MQFMARYSDGLVAVSRDVIGRIEGEGATSTMTVRDLESREDLASWPASAVHPVPARKDQLRMSIASQPGARLTLSIPGEIVRARELLPSLAEKAKMESSQQFRLAGMATLGLAVVIGAYLFGVPLLAGRLVGLVPTEWEARLGDTVASQMEAQLRKDSGFVVCDANPDSVANRAIMSFANAAMEGSGSPFAPTVTIIKTDIPNAFALPGGRTYYFSALLDETENQDEFAGVLAHELGHVVHRHGMEQLIASAGTGALIGFVLGDMTGASVAAGLGSTLIDAPPRQADLYSAEVATRMAFQPAALPNLLDRVAKDDSFSRAMALLSTHPLTDERRAELARFVIDQSALHKPFSDAEWLAIKAMCGPPKGKLESSAGNGDKSGSGD
jgi:predicted Zn-dependent protease